MLTQAYVQAVLMRGAINELRFPRLCLRRSCRRHHTCFDRRDGEPRCMAALHDIDRDAMVDLYNLVIQILWLDYPARPADDAAQRDLEDDAIQVIFDCLDALPGLRPQFFDWHDRYDAEPVPPTPPTPPAAPTPPVDTRALLAEMKATLARDTLLGSLRG